MGRKFFFFDIDGTLTDRKTGLIVPSAAEALQKLREAGHFVAINTGRAHYKARKFFDENGFENMVCNGGMAIVTRWRSITRPWTGATGYWYPMRIRSGSRPATSGSTIRPGSARNLPPMRSTVITGLRTGESSIRCISRSAAAARRNFWRSFLPRNRLVSSDPAGRQEARHHAHA